MNILPNGIPAGMVSNNIGIAEAINTPKVRMAYKQKSFDKPLFQVSVGKREALDLGYSYSGGIVINRNNLWDSGITLSGGIGIGVEQSYNLTKSTKLNRLIDMAASTIDLSLPTSTADIEGSSINAYAGAGFGISADTNSDELKGIQLGTVGGGVYYEKTIVITAGKIAEGAYNTGAFIMNQIFNHSGMSRLTHIDYIELDGRQ